MKLISLFKYVRSSRQLVLRFGKDKRGVAAVEFVFIAPLMLTLLFGMIDVSSGVAIDRKVTVTARTLSDLVSQGTKVSSTDISNFFKMGSAIMTPYAVTPATMTQRISAVSIDASKKAKVVWSYSGAVSGASSVTVTTGYAKDTVITTIPVDLLVANTQLIWSEVTYTFTPITGYIIQTTVPLSENCYTRPRQSDTVTYTS
ncbi:MAG: pilus assembly protein [Candidatus Afipia apatlaquensis]|uniref:Pilus assembly protein n=1 Tax=Candidatus Afipia apatlaquensis TaxID=2712852 RepID=A0A7C9VF70_9BRAD|nr:pilus assembly protein [Candidatus Afipia apatlaquensis]